MSFETLEYSIENSVARITLNRPNNANAINLLMAKELSLVAIDCDENPDVRAVILTANGKMFCAGGDLASFAEDGDKISAGLKELTMHFHSAVSRFMRMSAPLVVAVNGTAAGAGVSLVGMGDYNIASPSAKFTLAYTAAGLCPDGGATHMLPRLVGERRAKELILTNRVLSAEEAVAWGLVNEVADSPEALLEKAQAMANQFASGPNCAYGTVKELLLSSSHNSFETQMEIEARSIAKLAGGKDGQEGISAFLQKRKPSFKGQP